MQQTPKHPIQQTSYCMHMLAQSSVASSCYSQFLIIMRQTIQVLQLGSYTSIIQKNTKKVWMRELPRVQFLITCSISECYSKATAYQQERYPSSVSLYSFCYIEKSKNQYSQIEWHMTILQLTLRTEMLLSPEVCYFSDMNKQLKCMEMLLRNFLYSLEYCIGSRKLS